MIFDQTSCPGFPGSSGGGVFLSERTKGHEGHYVGMLVRGAGETFNLIVPVRRMRKYAKSNGVLWALDQNAPTPSYEDILKLPVEGTIDSKDGNERQVFVRFYEVSHSFFEMLGNPPTDFTVFAKATH